jgi:hypothetical protein
MKRTIENRNKGNTTISGRFGDQKTRLLIVTFHAKSHHHPLQKHAVLTTQINHTTTICDTG